MISLIVSSYKDDLFTEFEKSVKETIGIPFEIIRIVNIGQMGICEAYNKGASKAKYEYLCFSHEDIIFNTINWGKILINDIESNPQIGLIGIAGSFYKPWVISGWGNIQGKFNAMNLIQMNDKSEEQPRKILLNESGKFLTEVAVLDGCFLFSTKKVFKKYQFDQNTFKDFHCYDVDYSLQVGQSFKIIVTYNILISHLSEGSFNKKWLFETFKLHKKWGSYLPIAVDEISKSDSIFEEYGAYFKLFERIIEFKMHYFHILKILFSFKFIKLLGIKKWYQLLLKSIKFIRYRRYLKKSNIDYISWYY